MLTLLNLLSLVFGMAAWAFAIYARAKDRKPLYIVGSFSCCGVALVGQILAIGCRAFRGDYSGIEDTIVMVITASAVLLLGTVLLNFSRPSE